MGTFPNTAKAASGTLSSASYLKAPPPFHVKWQKSIVDNETERAYLHLLSHLSKRIDISGILRLRCPLAVALKRAFEKWFEMIYPKTMLEFFDPELKIYLHPDDPEINDERFLRITFSNEYINWREFEISDAVEAAERNWPGTGISVLNALTNLPFRHYVWTPDNIMNFVREIFWCGYQTEKEWIESEYSNWSTYNGDESMYPFNDETLKPLTLWENREPAAEANPIAKELLEVCDRITANKIDSIAFGTTFPTGIIWRDEDNMVSEIIDQFEMDQREMDNFLPHAGGTQWECKNLKNLERILNQIELYIIESEELVNAIINFKTRMQPWMKKA